MTLNAETMEENSNSIEESDSFTSCRSYVSQQAICESIAEQDKLKWNIWILWSKEVTTAIKQHQEYECKLYSRLTFALKIWRELQVVQNCITLKLKEYFQLLQVTSGPSVQNGDTVFEAVEMKVANNYRIDPSFLKFKVIFQRDIAAVIMTFVKQEDIILIMGGRLEFHNYQQVIKANSSINSPCTVIKVATTYDEVWDDMNENSTAVWPVECRKQLTKTIHKVCGIRKIIRITPKSIDEISAHDSPLENNNDIVSKGYNVTTSEELGMDVSNCSETFPQNKNSPLTCSGAVSRLTSPHNHSKNHSHIRDYLITQKLPSSDSSHSSSPKSNGVFEHNSFLDEPSSDEGELQLQHPANKLDSKTKPSIQEVPASTKRGILLISPKSSDPGPGTIDPARTRETLMTQHLPCSSDSSQSSSPRNEVDYKKKHDIKDVSVSIERLVLPISPKASAKKPEVKQTRKKRRKRY